MDLNRIYLKTASGEEAMHRRTRVMQRNLRMVLILVDGKSTVNDLSLKIGNPQLTENALAELEQGGFIAPKEEQDSLWSESKKVAQEIRDAALNKAVQAVTPSRPGEAPAARPIPELEPLSVQSAFNDTAFPFPPMPFAQGDRPVLPPPKTKPAAGPSAGLLQRGAALAKKLTGILSGGVQQAARERDVTLKPVRRGRRGTALHWSVALPLGVIALLVLAAAFVVLFPYDAYRPDIETALTRALGQPVKIVRVRAELYPKPGLWLSDVRIGDSKSWSVPEIYALPELGSLFSTRLRLGSVVLRGSSLPLESVARLPALFASLNAPAAKIKASNVRLEKTELTLGALSLPDMEGDLTLGGDGAFTALRLHTATRTLDVEARPVDAGVALKVEGVAWRPGEKSAWVVDGLDLQGVLARGVLTVKAFEIRAFEGIARGSAVISSDGAPGVVGTVAFERINVASLGETLGIGSVLSGNADGKASFSAVAANWSSLLAAPEVEATLTVSRGNVRGIDLAEAVRRASQAPIQGGATQFEKMKASLHTSKAGYSLTGVSLDSGLMLSSGSVEVDRDLTLKGHMDLQMRGTANQMRVAVSLGGTLAAPELRALAH